MALQRTALEARALKPMAMQMLVWRMLVLQAHCTCTAAVAVAVQQQIQAALAVMACSCALWHGALAQRPHASGIASTRACLAWLRVHRGGVHVVSIFQIAVVQRVAVQRTTPVTCCV